MQIIKVVVNVSYLAEILWGENDNPDCNPIIDINNALAVLRSLRHGSFNILMGLSESLKSDMRELKWKSTGYLRSLYQRAI